MAIPLVNSSGRSRAVSINVVNHLTIKPPEIFIERTHILANEQLVISWKPSRYFDALRVQISRDANFTDIVQTTVATDPKGSHLGKFASGQFWIRAEWEPASAKKA